MSVLINLCVLRVVFAWWVHYLCGFTCMSACCSLVHAKGVTVCKEVGNAKNTQINNLRPTGSRYSRALRSLELTQATAGVSCDTPVYIT